jgi:uncharacterized phiE125 gp8 family phage protein
MRSLRVIARATVEPITLADAKLHLRVDDDTDDILIEALIAAARDYCERFTGLALTAQSLEYIIDGKDAIFLPISPVASVESVASVLEGVESELTEGADYWINLDSIPASITKARSFDELGVIKINYTTDASELPPIVRAALMLKLGLLYSDRGGENTNTYADEAIDNLLRQYRVLFGMA